MGLHSGLDEHELKRIIRNKISKDPDIFYYIDNKKIEVLTNLLIEGVVEAIERNNRRLEEDLTQKFSSRRGY